MNDEILIRKKIFIRFLKENNCYTNFLFNLRNGNFNKKSHNTCEINLFDALYKRLKECNEKTPNVYVNEIHLAFFWGSTKEGILFWDEIGEKLRKFELNENCKS